MKNRIIALLLISIFLISAIAVGQEKEQASVEKVKKPRLKDFYVNLSSSGTGVGMKIHYLTDNPDTKFSFGIQLMGVRGENEYEYYDPYTFNYVRGNRNFFTLFTPVTFGVKRRLWRESIESDFRPFLLAEVGPVFGVAFPTNDGFNHGVKRGKGQVAAGAFIGFGVDFGDQLERVFGVTIGSHFIAFPKTLGEKKTYTGFDIRFSFLNYF